MKKFLTLIFLSIVVCWQSYAFTVKIIKVIAGDTFYAKILEKHTDKNVIVHLWGIDCPEHDQPFGKEAVEFVRDFLLIPGSEVTVENKGKGINGSILGIVKISSFVVNEELLKNGLAWVYPKYYKGKLYYSLEKKAKMKQLNIWSLGNPIAPWDWRDRE